MAKCSMGYGYVDLVTGLLGYIVCVVWLTNHFHFFWRFGIPDSERTCIRLDDSFFITGSKERYRGPCSPMQFK